jgi:hypothetical protein
MRTWDWGSSLVEENGRPWLLNNHMEYQRFNINIWNLELKNIERLATKSKWKKKKIEYRNM